MVRAGGACAQKAGGGRSDSKGSKGSGGARKSSKEDSFLKSLQGNKSSEDLEELMNSDKFSELAERYSAEIFHDAASLPAVVLMNNGKFDDLTISDVKELFTILDRDGSGTLEFAEIEMLLKEVLDPPCTAAQIELIYNRTDACSDGDSDGLVSAEELLLALKGPVKDELKRMQKENNIKKEFARNFGFNITVDRELLVDRLKWSVGRDDAFRTLPFSLVYICIFIFLVINHLNIWERQQSEKAVEEWIEGYGAQLLGPYLGAVSDIEGMFGYLLASGLPAVFGKCQNVTLAGAVVSAPFCNVGTRNVLVGDAKLKQNRRGGGDQSIWLLHSEQALEHLRLKPGDYLGAATAAVKHVHKSGWADAKTLDIRLSFASYGERAQLFTMTTVKARFDDYGYAVPKVDASAAVVIPYPPGTRDRVIIFGFDTLYIIFLALPMYNEIKDLRHGMHMAGYWDGWKSYWEIWNVVDWTSILTGLASIIVWSSCCQAMNTETIQGLLQNQDEQIVMAPGVMSLPASLLAETHEDLEKIISLVSVLRYTMGCTACSILMKFFKAFQANPRLQVVTNTMVKAGSDIFHFSVVFFAVFLGFAVTGHIFFGNDLRQFRNIATSIDTCFIVLMGDFGWYELQAQSDVGPASGIPYALLAIWFWLYMVFVLMIMLNMLLAIILDHYTELVNQIKLDVDVPSLWQQTYRYYEQAKTTKDHIPLPHLVHLLEDDDTPCHEEQVVAIPSLRRAFPEMSPDQATHLMDWLKAEAKKRLNEKDDELLARVKVLHSSIEHINQDLSVVKLNAAVCNSRLKELHGDPRESSKRAAGGAAGGAFSEGAADQLVEQVNRLTLRIGSAIRDLSARIGNATQDLSSQNDTLRMTALSEAEAMSLNQQEVPMCSLKAPLF